MTSHLPEELRRLYGAHFEKNRDYRQRIWSVLVRDFFQTHVSSSATVLDLGCGYGEFINCIQCGQKLALDLNPEAAQFLAPEVRFLQQDCSTHWQCGNESLDVVFTCNFSEYLPSKEALRRMLSESFRCLKPGGTLLAMGPNIRNFCCRFNSSSGLLGNAGQFTRSVSGADEVCLELCRASPGA